MRQACKTVYTFEELSESAKDKARDWYRQGFEYSWSEENHDSLKAFADEFGLSNIKFEYGGYSTYCTATINDDDIAQLSGVRLWKYLNNNHDMDKLTAGDCPFTGYCMDESLMDHMREFMQKPDSRDYEDLIADCLSKWAHDCEADFEYQYSDESIDESITINEYEFTENGEFYS